MVDFARIQNRIYYGYTKAAIRLGVEHAIYRSVDGNDPLKITNFIKNTLVSIDADLTYKKARKYGDLVWQFLPEDGLTLQNYDYMVGASTTYFIADIAPDDRLTPPLCVECNHTVSITTLANTLVPGDNDYQAIDNPTNYIVDCPVSIVQYTRMDMNNLKTPSSVKMPTYYITMPDFDGVVIKNGDIVTNENNNRYTVISAEQTKKSLGLRLLVQLTGT